MNVIHVDGTEKGEVFLFALSTCGWCRKTKQLLKDLNVAYDYVDVDLAQGDDRKEITQAVKKWNPAQSFPVVVLNNTKAIIGFDEQALREAFAEK